jgi:tight adherence protein B
MARTDPPPGNHPGVARAVALLVALSMFAGMLLVGEARAAATVNRLLRGAGFESEARAGAQWESALGALRRARTPVLAVGLAAGGAALGGLVAGPVGLLAGAAGAAAIPSVVRRRQARGQAELKERELAELSEGIALAVRSGLSVTQAIEFVAPEVEQPLRRSVDELVARQRLGRSFENSLRLFGREMATDDARLLVVILSVHAKAGGNLAAALDEVTTTIRNRIAIRRELRALSAQGRISGLILASLPIGFALVLATTSRDELAPIYRSATGMLMVAGGLLMEAIAFLWIRRLLRINV